MWSVCSCSVKNLHPGINSCFFFLDEDQMLSKIISNNNQMNHINIFIFTSSLCVKIQYDRCHSSVLFFLWSTEKEQRRTGRPGSDKAAIFTYIWFICFFFQFVFNLQYFCVKLMLTSFLQPMCYYCSDWDNHSWQKTFAFFYTVPNMIQDITPIVLPGLSFFSYCPYHLWCSIV